MNKKSKNNIKVCKECNNHVSNLYELVGTIACRNCWHEYWQENDIGEDTSFEDFIRYTCTEVGGKE